SAYGIAAVSSGTNGKVVMARAQIGGISGDQLVGKATFKAKTTAGDASFVFTSETSLIESINNTNILPSVASAHGLTYKIENTTPAPTPTPTPPPPTPTPTPTPTPLPTPSPSPAPTPTNTATSSSKPAPSVYVSPFNKTIQPGQTFTVEVRTNSGNTNVNAVNAEFTYPTNLVDFVSFDYTGSAYGIAAVSSGTNGKVVMARAQIGGISGDQLVGKATFKAKTTGGNAKLSFLPATSLLESTNNTNILPSASSAYGVSYTVVGSSTTTPPPADKADDKAKDQASTSTDTSKNKTNTNTNTNTNNTSVNQSPTATPTPSDDTDGSDNKSEEVNQAEESSSKISAVIVIKDTDGKLVKNTKVFINGKEYKTDNKGQIQYKGEVDSVLKITMKAKDGTVKDLGSVTLVKGATDQKYDLVSSVPIPQSNTFPIIPIVTLSIVLLLLAGGFVGVNKYNRTQQYKIAHGLASDKTYVGEPAPNQVNQPTTIITPSQEPIEEDINQAAKKIIDEQK
nr:hypothetical protein [Candidatus Saccharibacteria bacterium]